MIIKRTRVTAPSSFTVSGELNGEPYSVTCGGLAGLDGTENVMRLLVTRSGDHYAATPTGPFGQLDMDKPETVLGALLDWTNVHSVTGAVPDILGGQRAEPGVVY